MQTFYHFRAPPSVFLTIMLAHFLCIMGIWDHALEGKHVFGVLENITTPGPHHILAKPNHTLNTPMHEMYKTMFSGHAAEQDSGKEHQGGDGGGAVETDKAGAEEECASPWARVLAQHPFEVILEMGRQLMDDDGGHSEKLGGEDAGVLSRRGRQLIDDDGDPRNRGSDTTASGSETGSAPQQAHAKRAVGVLHWVHGVPILFVFLFCVPALYIKVCGRTKRGGVLSLLSFVLLYSTTVWGCDMLLVSIHPHLGLCLGMHQTAQFLYAFARLCHEAPDLPVVLPGAVGALVHAVHAWVVLYITHASAGPLSGYDTTDFYMGHVWALVMAEFVRCTVGWATIFIWRAVIARDAPPLVCNFEGRAQ